MGWQQFEAPLSEISLQIAHFPRKQLHVYKGSRRLRAVGLELCWSETPTSSIIPADRSKRGRESDGRNLRPDTSGSTNLNYDDPQLIPQLPQDQLHSSGQSEDGVKVPGFFFSFLLPGRLCPHDASQTGTNEQTVQLSPGAGKQTCRWRRLSGAEGGG